MVTSRHSTDTNSFQSASESRSVASDSWSDQPCSAWLHHLGIILCVCHAAPNRLSEQCTQKPHITSHTPHHSPPRTRRLPSESEQARKKKSVRETHAYAGCRNVPCFFCFFVFFIKFFKRNSKLYWQYGSLSVWTFIICALIGMNAG